MSGQYSILNTDEFDDEPDLTRPLHGCRAVFAFDKGENGELLIVYNDAAIIIFDGEGILIGFGLPVVEDIDLFEEALVAQFHFVVRERIQIA